LGGSEGVRRAGHNVSIEPGIIYKMKKMSFYTYVPIIFERETKQTLSDQFKSNRSCTYILIQSCFADYVVFVGALFKL